ncbi:uncharacterized protein LOC119680883 [Teleopsis dalmanni]|uniref:uncharacterized protein LOC119680883 n=1 Tax=Teleopsis dalmanni TaxID=139649 RepID=UPI0018CD67BF|nr:uncharacterized protein LOC119680883 [Teleopsis dalmanni]
MPPNNDIINPNENLEIPKWITADYFTNILEKDEPNYKKVIKFTPTAAIPPGENFTSIMLRVHIDLEMKDGSKKRKTYVLKTQLDDEKGGSDIKKMSLFPKEMEMYRTYLPAFEELYEAAGWQVQLSPKCIFTELNDGRINFVFEDLQTKNFKNINRLKGCNMGEMRRILQKLAEYHAASAIYAEQHGPYPEDFQSGFVHNNEGYGFHKNLYNSRVNAYKKAISGWGLEDADKYIKNFPTFEQYWKCCQSTLDTSNNKFNVLTHGDFWSSNLMFNSLPDGEVDELLLLDFQICKWGSPAEDLLFFISISAAKDIRIKEFDHFVEIYYERLIECLKLLKFKQPLPQLREIQIEMFSKHNSFYAFFACFNHLFLVLLPSDKDSNINFLLRDDEEGEKFRMRAFMNPAFKETMRDLYPFYYRRGLFNFQDYDN